MGEMMDGGMAQYCLVDAEQLIRMPEFVAFEDAASLPVAYGTAHRMLVTHNTIKAADRVLVLGASGGVGTGCVLLAKLAGAEVIVCAGGEKKMQRLRDLGADHVIDYKQLVLSSHSPWRTCSCRTTRRARPSKSSQDLCFRHVCRSHLSSAELPAAT
jgi:alcohol dehydrogenase